MNMIIGCAYWWCWFYLCVNVGGIIFAFSFVLYPFFENGVSYQYSHLVKKKWNVLIFNIITVLILASVNWSWHAFLDPSDVDDVFVGSLTIIDGPMNLLNEDFHVVHHMCVL